MAKGDFRKQLRQISEEREKELKENNSKDFQDYRNINTYKGEIRRGDIFYFDKGYSVGVEQQGGRPGIIVSNDKCNNSSEFVLVIYMTTEPKTNLPTHVNVNSGNRPSIALCEQIHTLSKFKMQSYHGHVTDEEMENIEKAIMTTLDIQLEGKYLQDSDQLEVDNKTLKIRTENLLKTKENLEEQLEALKAQPIVPLTTDSSDLVKAIAERDTYKKLYDELLVKFLKSV